MFMILPDDEPRSGLLAKLAEGDNSPAQTVSELSAALKRAVEDAFGQVRVRGEISGFKKVGSGHCYFTLKDESACIDAVIWRGNVAGLAFKPEDGAEVIASGKLTTYPGRSKYQIVVDRLELAGEGALLALLERRRKALAAEGLFDESRKRPLPFLPRVIGVVTSPTGAVIRDILHRLSDRCPGHVLLWPVVVQGDGAAEMVAAAIRGFSAMDGNERPDLLIVARGGGSIEDLWAFNEEVVIRAAAECPIPLISAVGHETDTTLIDHVADRRAPTPTAAAEIAVPVRSELLLQLAELEHRAGRSVERCAAQRRERLDQIACRWPDPVMLFVPVGQRLDEIGGRLPRSLAARSASARADFNFVVPRLRTQLIETRIARARESLAGLWRLAELAHPDRPLERGYARVTDMSGKLVASRASAEQARAFILHFGDGQIGASVDPGAGDLRPDRLAPKVERRRPSRYSAPQPGLFDPPEEE